MLVDFGSARDVVLGTYGGTMQVGTYAYMPPEQLAGEVDQTSDLYALGGTLFHLMSRKSPRECFAPGGGSRLRELGGSPGLCHFVAKLMAPEHSARFRSAQMALSALEKGLEFPVVVRTSRLPTSMQGMVVGSVLVTGTAVGVGSWLWSFPQIRNDLHEIVGTGPVDGDESEEHAHWPPIEIPEDIQDVERQLEEFAAFSEKRKLDELSLEAQDNLHLLEDAQEAWKGSKGSYLLFKEATPETWSRLGIEPIGELAHNYRASLQDGELLLEAWGNLDDDESLDIWWAGPANGGGGAGQLATDALDMVLYPEAEGRYPPPEESD